MKKTYAIIAAIVLVVTAFYPQIVGISQVSNKKPEQAKKITPLPPVEALESPKNQLADKLQLEIKADRAKALALQNQTIKEVKKEIAQKERIVYRTIYKKVVQKTIDTVFIPIPLGSVYNPSDSNDYSVTKCKPDTVFVHKKGFLNRLFNW